MRIHLRGDKTRMSQKFLDRSNVRPLFYQVGGETVPQNMRTFFHLPCHKTKILIYYSVHKCRRQFFTIFMKQQIFVSIACAHALSIHIQRKRGQQPVVQRHISFLRTFAMYKEELPAEIHIARRNPAQFGATQATTVESSIMVLLRNPSGSPS